MNDYSSNERGVAYTFVSDLAVVQMVVLGQKDFDEDTFDLLAENQLSEIVKYPEEFHIEDSEPIDY